MFEYWICKVKNTFNSQQLKFRELNTVQDQSLCVFNTLLIKKVSKWEKYVNYITKNIIFKAWNKYTLKPITGIQ